MSEHIEWADAKYARRSARVAAIGEIEGDESDNELPAFELGTGSSTMVIEGSKAALVSFAQRLLSLAIAIDNEESGCEGHLSTLGPIGNVTYCDGSCR